MKNFLLLCSVAFLISCNNDDFSKSGENQDLNHNAAKNSQSEIDILFREYYSSTEYSNYYNSAASFYSKLGNNDLLKAGVNEEIIFKYIKENLNSTSFSSITEAESIWKNKVNFQIELKKRFPSYAEIIRNYEPSDIVIAIDRFDSNFQSLGNTQCDKDLKACRDTARQTFIDAVRLVKESPEGDNNTNDQEDAYVAAQVKCKDDYVSCTNIKK